MADLKFHQGDRIVKVSWDPGAKTVFLVNIQIEALDRSRLLSDITRALSDQEVNILHAAVNTTKDQTAISRLLLRWQMHHTLTLCWHQFEKSMAFTTFTELQIVRR